MWVQNVSSGSGLSSKAIYQAGFLNLKLLIFAGLILGAQAIAEDCNGNGYEDSSDVAVKGFALQRLSGGLIHGFPQALLIEDLNLDGKEDIVIAGYTYEVAEEGSFNELIQISLIETLDGEGFFPILAEGRYVYQALENEIAAKEIRIGDADGNGFLDILFRADELGRWLLNRGDRSYELGPISAVTPASETPFPESVGASEQIGDLNGDGRLDLIRTNASSAEILLRSASGELLTESTFSFSELDGLCLGLGRPDITIAPLRDLDSDGDLDPIIMGNSICLYPLGTVLEGLVKVLENKGDGSFQSKEFGDSANFHFLKYQDMDKDGFEELIFNYADSTFSPAPKIVPRLPNSGLSVIKVIPQTTSGDTNANGIPDECERAVAGDFDGDRQSDLAVIRPNAGLFNWLIRHSSEISKHNPVHVPFGLLDYDSALPGDFDGNGVVEPAVVRNAGKDIPTLYGLYWYSLLSDDRAEVVQFGLPDDTPLTGYFDTDNKTDRIVVRRDGTNLLWFVRLSSSGSIAVVQWGRPGDSFFAADMFGDGQDELIVVRKWQNQIVWFIRSLDGTFQDLRVWGQSSDRPLSPADLDGDGLADLVVMRELNQFYYFFIWSSKKTPWGQQLGTTGDFPYLGHFSPEGIAEIAVLRYPQGGAYGAEMLHYWRTASGLPRSKGWGLSGDVPVFPYHTPVETLARRYVF